MITFLGDEYYSFKGYKAAQGQLVKACARFESDQNLTGFQINVNPGMWINGESAAQTMSPGYSRVYPLTTGNYEMDFQGLDDRYKNMRCELEVISPTTFAIYYYFIQTRDKYSLGDNGYLFEYDYNSISEIEDSTGQAFRQKRKLDLKITVDFISRVDVCHGLIDWQVKPFRTDANFSFIADGEYINGWRAGYDLDVKCVLFDVQASNEMYVSIYRIDAATNNERFVEDLELNMAYCISAPFTTGQSDLPYTAFLDSNGWQLVGGWFECNFTIDQNYFTDGGVYRIYITYKNVYENESVLSQLIPQVDENNLPQIEADYDVEATFENPNQTLTAHCYYGVNPCQEVTLTVNIDKSTFNASLIANDFPDLDIDDLIKSVRYSVTNNLTLNGVNLFTNWISTSIDDNGVTYGSTITFLIPDDWAGLTRYVNFKFDFEFPNGDVMTLVAPILLTITDYSEDITLIGDKPNYICDTEGDQTFTFEGPSELSEFDVKILAPILEDLSDSGKGTNDTDFGALDADVTVDYQKLPYGISCLKLLASEIMGDGSDCAALCDWVSIFIKNNTRPTNSYTLTWNFDNPFPADCIKRISFTDINTGVLLNDTEAGPDPIDIGTFIFQRNKLTGRMSVTVLTFSGQIYTVEFNTNIQELQSQGEWGVTWYSWICDDPEIPIPTEALPCSYTPSLVVVCDTASQQWEALLDDGGYSIDSFEYTTDDGAVWYNYFAAIPFGSFEKIQFRAVLSGGTPCGTIELWNAAELCYDCLGALPVNPCDTFLEIEQSWDEGTELLTLNETLDPGCIIDAEIDLQYSYDGISYTTYTVPIDTSTTDKVFYKRWVHCEDGCEKSIATFWERECPKNGCGDIKYDNLDEIQLYKIGGVSGDTFTIPAGALFVEVQNLGIKEVTYVIDGLTSTLRQSQAYKFDSKLNSVTNRQTISRELVFTLPASASVSVQVGYPKELAIDLTLI